MTNRLSDRQPTHPGEILREDVVPALGLSKTEIAARLGVSRVAFYDLLNEKTGVARGWRSALPSFWAMAPASGSTCKLPMTCGMRSAAWTHRAFRRSRPEGPLEPEVHILKMPKRVSGTGALRQAENARPSTSRVSSGAITPSSHSRAVA